MKFIFFFYSLILFAPNLIGQNLAYKQYTEENGMENAEISCLTINKNDILYFGTMNGISSFNSSKFNTYKERDSSSSNYILSIKEHNNVIYFSTMSGLFSFDGNSYKSLVSESKIYNITFFEKNKHIYYSKGNTLYKLSTTELKPQPTKICILPDSNASIKYIQIESNNSIFISTIDGLYQYINSTKLIKISSLPSFCTFKNKKNILFNITHFSIEKYDIHQKLICTTKYREDFFNIFKIRKSFLKVYTSQHENYIYLYAPLLSHNFIDENDKKRADFALQSHKIFQIDYTEETPKIVTFSSPKELINPTSFINDSKGNLWFSTLDGLFHFFIPEKRYTYQYKKTRLAVGNISMIRNKVSYTDQSFTGYMLDKLFQTDSITFKPILQNAKKTLAGTIFAMQSDTAGNILVATLKKGIAIQRKNGDVCYLNDSSSTSFICMSKDKNGIIYLGGVDGVYTWNGKSFQKTIADKQLEDVYIFDILVKNNDIYLATSSGLLLYKNKKIENLSQKIGIQNITFSSLAFDNINRLIAGTYEKGIYIFEKKGNDYSLYQSLSKKDGLSSNSVNSVIIDNSHRIWASTSKNIDILISKKSTYKIIPFQVNAIFKDNIWGELKLFRDSINNIFIGGKNGLLYFNASDYTIDSVNKNVSLVENVKLNNSQINLSYFKKNKLLTGVPQNIHFTYTQNNLSFEYTAIDYSNSKVYYQYILKGLEKKWSQPTFEKIANYRNLPPGEYKFLVRHLINGNWSDTVSYSFTISPPWWKTNLFYFICLFTTILLFSLLYKMQINKIRKKQELKIQDLENKNKNLSLQSAALINQMNPHFIYNALAPLQNYLYTNNKESGIKYLNTISKLLRSMLNHSRESLVTLDSEINFLQLYLTQQQIEKNFKFDFSIIHNLENLNIKTPSLLIQPILENCIEHGFNEGHKGHLTINIKKTNDNYISILIQENGLGFDLDQKMKTNNNSALNIIYDRIELLKKLPLSSNSTIESIKTENFFTIILTLPIYK